MASNLIPDDLRNAGADSRDVEVLRDGNWVSSRKPVDLPAFNREMLALFAEHQTGQTDRPRRISIRRKADQLEMASWRTS